MKCATLFKGTNIELHVQVLPHWQSKAFLNALKPGLWGHQNPESWKPLPRFFAGSHSLNLRRIDDKM